MSAEDSSLKIRHDRRRRRMLRLLKWKAEMLLHCHAALDYERYYVRHDLDLVNMPNEKMRHHFRMENYQDFCRLRDALQLPEVVVCENGVKASNTLALAVLLKRLAFPNRWVDCMDLLGRERTQLSRIFNATVSAIHRTHRHLLENMDQPWLTRERVDVHANAVSQACGYYDNCWAFIDGTARAICRPKRHQREQYSGHSRKHVMKFQSICTPDGLIVNMYGPCAGRRHDGFMLGESNMRERLRFLNQKWGRQMCVFGDKGYSLSEEIQVPYKGSHLTAEQLEFNEVMSRNRVTVEYGFMAITRDFAFANYEKNQKIYWQQVAKTYLVTVILSNCLVCMYGFPLIRNKFGVDPPPLEIYLGLVDEN